MATVTVLTVSKRTGWERIAKEQLKGQSYKDFDWVIVTEEAYSHSSLQPWGDTQVTHLMAPKKKDGAYSNLNASLNKGLANIDSDYVIFYQDFIELEPDCFDKLVANATQNTFVTTVTKNPPGQRDDPRYLGLDLIRPCMAEEWEANVAIAPMPIIRELGGFDERLDFGWSWDNALLALKAEMLGCKFLLDESNRPQLLFHVKEPELNPDMPLNGELCAKIVHNIRLGNEPLNAGHL